jgi:hypothetical protein
MNIESESLYENNVPFEKLMIKRPVYSQKDFDKEYLNKDSLQEVSKCSFKAYDPRRIINLFTILNLITEYDIKNNFISDLIAGFTVGVV